MMTVTPPSTQAAILRLLLAALLTASLATDATARTYGSVSVREVNRVLDGNTFQADIFAWPAIIGEDITIQLKDVEVPALDGQCPAETALAQEARQFTARALENATRIQLEAMERGDTFRILARVRVEGRNLGDQLVLAELAHPRGSRQPPDWCR